MEGQDFQGKENLLALFLSSLFINSVPAEHQEKQWQNVGQRRAVKRALLGGEAHPVENPGYKLCKLVSDVSHPAEQRKTYVRVALLPFPEAGNSCQLHAAWQYPRKAAAGQDARTASRHT